MAKAIFQNIYQTLKRDIDNGTYAYQELLPSEAELTRRFDCSHSTIRRALAELTADGYVQPLHGKGVRVIHSPMSQTLSHSDTNGLETNLERAARLGFEPKTRCMTFEVLTADANLAHVTGFTEGSELLHVYRVRYFDDRGISSDESYYLASELPGITRADVEHSVYAYLENVLGMQIVISKRVVTVERVNDNDLAYLALDGADYVSVSRCNAYDNNGIMVEYTESREVPSFFRMHVNALRRKQI